MSFADALAKKKKEKAQLAQERKEALECRTAKEVERVVRLFKEECILAAEEGKHTLKKSYIGEVWRHRGERPFDEQEVAKRVEAILKQESFKRLTVRSFYESDYDIDYTIGVKIVAKW